MPTARRRHGAHQDDIADDDRFTGSSTTIEKQVRGVGRFDEIDGRLLKRNGLEIGGYGFHAGIYLNPCGSATEAGSSHSQAFQEVRATVWPPLDQVEQEMKLIAAHCPLRAVRGRRCQAQIREIMGASAIQWDDVVNVEIVDRQ